MTCSRDRIRLVGLIIGLVVSCAWTSGHAQEQSASTEGACFKPAVVSVPSRPTVANATDTTQCGVVELEYGLERQWPGSGANRDDLSGGLRLGLTRNLDFHWFSAAFLHVMDGNGDRTCFGDTWLGLKYRFLEQKKHRPSLGVFYQAKVPSASVVLGLGSGEVDHAISALVSKDIHHLHFDFNLTQFLVGRPSTSGFDHNLGFALASWLPLTHRLNLLLEPYGYTLLSQNIPAFASATVGFTLKVHPRLYLDTGFDVGVTHDAPQKRVYVGITYAIANAYSWMRPQH